MANTFTYNENLLTDLDWVRFRLGDVDAQDPLLSDELLTALMTKYGVAGATLLACDSLIIFFGKEPSTVVFAGGKRISFQDRFKSFSMLRDALEMEFQMDLDSSSGDRSGVLPDSLQDQIFFLPMQPLTGSAYAGTEANIRSYSRRYGSNSSRLPLLSLRS